MNRAQQLAEQFRNGNWSAVAAEVVCDGPTALALAAILDPEELSRLRRAVDDHLDRKMVVGGEARGGPVMIERDHDPARAARAATVPLRGVVR